MSNLSFHDPGHQLKPDRESQFSMSQSATQHSVVIKKAFSSSQIIRERSDILIDETTKDIGRPVIQLQC